MATDRLAVGVEEAAELCGLSKFTLAAKTRSGEIPSIRIGRRRLIAVEDLRAWLREHRVGGESAGRVRGGLPLGG